MRGGPDWVSQTEVPVAEKLVGRQNIVRALLSHIRQGRSALLLGPAGIGKTAILRGVAGLARLAQDGPLPIYCEQAATLKIALVSMAEALLAQEIVPPAGRARRSSSEPSLLVPSPRALKTLSSGRLRGLVVPRLRAGRHAVLLDHVGLVRGAYEAFLDGLVEHVRIPVVAAARSLDHTETGKLWWVGCGFERIEVPELNPVQARQLIEAALDMVGVTLPDHVEFVGRLIRLARGNPRVMTRLCDMARLSRYQIGGRTDLRLLWLDMKMQDIQHGIDAEAQIPLMGPIPFTPG